MAVDAAAGTGSLRSLGAGGQQAAAGDHAHAGGGTPDASTTVKGLNRITPAPATANDPEAVGSNHEALSLARSPHRLWMPTGAVAETTPRAGVGGTVPLVSGTVRLAGGAVLPAGQAISSITFLSGAALATITQQWFVLVRASDRARLAITVDGGAAAWGADTAKTLNLSATYTPTVDEAVYLGICVVATTMGTHRGQGGTTATNTLAPTLSGSSSVGLTDAASCPATLAAIGPVSALLLYAYAS